MIIKIFDSGYCSFSKRAKHHFSFRNNFSLKTYFAPLMLKEIERSYFFIFIICQQGFSNINTRFYFTVVLSQFTFIFIFRKNNKALEFEFGFNLFRI